ncbi:MAG: hypothetical protein ACKOW9_06595 [Candidatus Paceibacterota bacterium]
MTKKNRVLVFVLALVLTGFNGSSANGAESSLLNKLKKAGEARIELLDKGGYSAEYKRKYSLDSSKINVTYAFDREKNAIVTDKLRSIGSIYIVSNDIYVPNNEESRSSLPNGAIESAERMGLDLSSDWFKFDGSYGEYDGLGESYSQVGFKMVSAFSKPSMKISGLSSKKGRAGEESISYRFFSEALNESGNVVIKIKGGAVVEISYKGKKGSYEMIKFGKYLSDIKAPRNAANISVINNDPIYVRGELDNLAESYNADFSELLVESAKARDVTEVGIADFEEVVDIFISYMEKWSPVKYNEGVGFVLSNPRGLSFEYCVTLSSKGSTLIKSGCDEAGLVRVDSECVEVI